MTSEEQELYIKQLHELADEQHPHMKGHNHTRTMVDKAFGPEKLSATEAFDCGKYYQRMLEQPKHMEYLSAILQFKYASCKNKV